MTPTNKPYIIIAQQYWFDDLGSNARNIAMELGKTRPVLYVNPPLDVNTIVKHGKSQQVRRRISSLMNRNTAQQVEQNIWVHTPGTVFMSINWLQSNSLFDVVNRTNAYTFFNSIRKALKTLGWNAADCTVFNDSQMFTGLYVKRFLQPLQSFYYIRDNLVEHPYFKRHGSRIEPLTIGQADAIFANSAYLADYARKYNADSTDIGQGCELDMYNASQKREEPADLSGIPHPRIGYTGFLTGERLDIALLEQLAAQKKDWQWVLIGPEEVMFQQSQLHGMSNVHFLGSKKMDALPAYLQHMDVCMNPQQVNELTVGNYPRKIDEYLAIGKPVVATDTPAMQMFLPHVHLAVGAEQYIHAIEAALAKHDEAKAAAAIGFANSHTWINCLNKIYDKQTTLLHD